MTTAKKTTTKKTTTAKKEVAVKKATRKELAKKIDKNSEVLVMNNCMGGFIYKCSKTHEVIDLGERGDTQIVSVETIQHMKNTAKGILEKYWLLIIDVMDDEFTIEELFSYLGMDKYAEYMMNMDESLEDILDNNYTQFLSIINSIDKNLLSRLVEYAVDRYEAGEFNDHNKMIALEKAVSRTGIFENIDIIKENI